VELLGASLFIALSNALKALKNGSLEQYKHNTFNIIITILENSDSYILLNLIVDFLFEWISSSTGPFTLREQHQIISKLCTFDRIQEVHLTPLFVRLVMLTEKSLTFLESNKGIKAQSMFKHLDVLGLLSPIESLRLQTQGRLRNKWGDSVTDAFIGIMRSDCSCFVSRYWVACMPSLLFSCISGKVKYTYTCDSSIETRLASQNSSSIILSKDDVYTRFLVYMSDISENSKLMLDSLSIIAFSDQRCVRSCLDEWLESVWKFLEDDRRQLIIDSVIDNSLRTKYKQSILWPSNTIGYKLNTSRRYSDIESYESNVNFSTARRENVVLVNVPKEFLRLLSQLQPPPILPEEYLCALSRNYSTAFESLEFLTNSKSCNEASLKTVLHLLSEDIEDEDASLIFLRSNSMHMATKSALSFELYGHYEEAQNILYNAMKSYNIDDVASSELYDQQLLVPKTLELEMWEQRWVEVSRKLSNWQLLLQYSEQLNIVNLNIEAAAMTSDWARVKDLRKFPSVVALLERGVPKSKLIDIMLSVVENNSPEADKLCAQSVQMALIRWHQLPHMYASSVAHHRLFNQFHQIIELRESVSLMNEVLKCHRERTVPDLRGITKAWRQRLPNDWEGLKDWESIFIWRNQVFGNVQKLLDQGSTTRAGDVVNDICWTTLKLAAIASKRNLINSSNSIIEALETDKVGPVEKFGILEQKLLNFSRSGRGSEGLKFITRQSMDIYDVEQTAHLVRLKSLLQHKCYDHDDEARKSLSLCVQLQSGYGKGWFTWGQLILKLIDPETHIFHANAHLDLKSACVCILRAIECHVFKARFEIPKLLLLISVYDNDLKYGFEELASIFFNVDHSVWLPYVHFILLISNKVAFFKQLLVNASYQYPQYMLNELLYRTTPESVFISETLASKNWRLCRRLTSFNESAKADLRQGRLEETAQELEDIFFQICDQIGNTSSSNANALSRNISELLKRKLSEIAGESISEVEILRTICDDCTSKLTKKTNLSDILVFVNNWIQLLKASIFQNSNCRCPLLSEIYFGTSRGFDVNASSDSVEIPGFYRNILNVQHVNLHPLVCKVGFMYVPIERNSEYVRRINILGNDGIEYLFYLRKNSSVCDSERVCLHIFEFLDLSLKNHSQSRQRDTFLFHPGAVFVGESYELVRSDGSWTSLLEIYGKSCCNRGESTHLDIIYARQKAEDVINESKSFSSSNIPAFYDEAYKAACLRVPEDLLSAKFRSICTTAEAHYIYFRNFSSQLGIVSAVQCLLGSSAMGPQQFNFNLDSGKVILLGVLQSCLLDLRDNSRGNNDSKIPFRFTRSLNAVVNNERTRGILKMHLGLCLDAFSNFREVLENVLTIHVADTVDHVIIKRLFGISRSLMSNVHTHSPSLVLESRGKVQEDTAIQTTNVEIDSCIQELLHRAEDKLNYVSIGFRFYPWI